MLTVIGLGNPGDLYRGTRHNVGFWTIDALREMVSGGVDLKKPLFKPFLIGTAKFDGGSMALVKPLTYMNRSGNAVKGILRKTGAGPADVLVICDNMDLPPGELRFRMKGGSAGHKGMISIIETLGTDSFPRIFIGIGRPEQTDTVVDHVLGVPGPEEFRLLREAAETAAAGILRMTDETAEKIMNELNRKNPSRS